MVALTGVAVSRSPSLRSFKELAESQNAELATRIVEPMLTTLAVFKLSSPANVNGNASGQSRFLVISIFCARSMAGPSAGQSYSVTRTALLSKSILVFMEVCGTLPFTPTKEV
jgi:hypothetical protein